MIEGRQVYALKAGTWLALGKHAPGRDLKTAQPARKRKSYW